MGNKIALSLSGLSSISIGRWLICLALILFMVACTGNKEESNNPNKPKISDEAGTRFFSDDQFTTNVQQLEGDTWQVQDNLAEPVVINVIKDYLFIGDKQSQQPIHIFSTTTKEYLGSIGARGKGPNEFLSTTEFSLSPDGKIIWIYDLVLERFQGFDLEALSSQTLDKAFEFPYIQKVQFQAEALVGLLSKVNDSISVGSAMEGKKAIMLGRNDGSLKAKMGDIPQLSPPIPENLLVRYYGYDARVAPKGNKILAFAKFCDRATLFTLETQQEVTIIGPEGFPPKKQIADIPGMGGIAGVAKGTRGGYTDAAITQRSIYLLYSGRYNDPEETPLEFMAANTIYTLNHEGLPQKKLQLNEMISGFSLDEKNQTIYGMILKEDEYDIINFSFE